MSTNSELNIKSSFNCCTHDIDEEKMEKHKKMFGDDDMDLNLDDVKECSEDIEEEDFGKIIENFENEIIYFAEENPENIDDLIHDMFGIINKLKTVKRNL